MQPLAQFFDSENYEKVAFVLTNLNPAFAILNLIFCAKNNLRLQSERPPSNLDRSNWYLYLVSDLCSIYYMKLLFDRKNVLVPNHQ